MKYSWLNKDARLFLSRGYLQDGETPEQRYRAIAENAESILGINGFADKFEDYLSRGYYSLSTPVICNYGREKGLPVSCVSGETWINTKIDGGKQAKDISVGDEVLTHKGRYKKITHIMITPNRSSIYKIKIANRMTPLYITENHQILTNLGWIRVDEINPNIHLVAINGDIELKEQDYTIDLKVYCQRYEPVIIDGKIHKFTNDNTAVKYVTNTYEFVPVDNDLAWAFGFWFAEGSVAVNNKKQPSGIRITYNQNDEREIGEKWFNIIQNKFNVKGNTYSSSAIRNNTTNNWLTTNINSNIVGSLFASFGNGCKNKTIPQWIIELPKEKLFHFLNGLLSGDGTKIKDGGNRITVANPKMLLQIYQIGLKLGLQMSLQMQQKKSPLSTTAYTYTCIFRKYHTGVNKNHGNCAIKFENGLYYAPIKEICLTDKIEDVYDFTVEDDHSFSAAGVILHNCFNSYIPDNMSGILDKVAEVGMMSKMGGGTSGYFGHLRPRGASISAGGTSSGPVHFMELFDRTASVVSQGKSRRGSFAAYLDVEHPDIYEFLTIRNPDHIIQEMSFGVNISDSWMQSMIDGDVDKRQLWAAIIKKRYESGYPYINFIDNVNNAAPDVYKDKGMRIKSSNLCVAPETKLLTKNGEFPIQSLDGQTVEVWNGKQWSEALVAKTGVDQELLELNFVTYDTLIPTYTKLKCTKYHKFYITNDRGSQIETIASDLKINDVIKFQDDSGFFRTFVFCFKDYKNERSDTYCVNEPLEHKAVFNGILTGNCSEIALYQDEHNSFVCVLASINLLHWDEIKDTDAVETLIYFLDTVNEEFVRKAQSIKHMEAAYNFAHDQRALGMGVLGWHSYLQSKMIAFESLQAKGLTKQIFKALQERTLQASKELAQMFGEPPLLQGYGRRNTTLIAIAPTTSSSFILGQVSPSIEPIKDNYHTKDLAKGVFGYKNPFLEKLLAEKKRNNKTVWESIAKRGGSVQHLDFLSDDEKAVFKTFGEISQKEIIIQAAIRQEFIDQSQSLNLMVHPHTPPKEISDLMIFAWQSKIKSLYYQRSLNPTKHLLRSIMECKSCEG